jgi:hypothetical protein
LQKEPSRYWWKSDARRSLETYHEWAKRAWREEAANCSGEVGGPEYQSGFEDGFVDYVFAGGTGEPPPVPPRRFWNMDLRTPRGSALAEQWFAGYRHGAQVAREGGYRELSAVRSSLAGPPGPPPYGDQGYGPPSSEDAGPFVDDNSEQLPTPAGPSLLAPKANTNATAPEAEPIPLPKESGAPSTRSSEPSSQSTKPSSKPPLEVPLTPDQFSEPPPQPVTPPDAIDPDGNSSESSSSAAPQIKKGLFPNNPGRGGAAPTKRPVGAPSAPTAGQSTSLKNRTTSSAASSHRTGAAHPDSKWLPTAHTTTTDPWQPRGTNAAALKDAPLASSRRSDEKPTRPMAGNPTAAKQPLDLVPTDNDDDSLPTLRQLPNTRQPAAPRPTAPTASMFEM